jgi:hypothetical protein
VVVHKPVQVGLTIAGDETVESSITIVSNSSSDIFDGLWHSVVVRKSGSHVVLLTNERPSAETNAAATQATQTESDLFIGGIPSQSHDIDHISLLL